MGEGVGGLVAGECEVHVFVLFSSLKVFDKSSPQKTRDVFGGTEEPFDRRTEETLLPK